MAGTADLIQEIDLQAVVNGVPIGVMILDRDLKIAAVNQAFEALTGFSLEESLEVPCPYILRNDLCMKRCPARLALETGKPQTADGDIINRARERVPVSVHVSPLCDEDGQAIGAIGTIEKRALVGGIDGIASVSSDMADLIGHSPAMQKLHRLLPVVAQTDSPVLLTGDTGTGKDLIALLIHRLSQRAQGSFIKVNCAALPETLLESELFGHTRGAFTGAVRDKPGRFQLADGGTIYLTEIGDLHLSLQVKLLTVLDDKEVIPLGGTRSTRTDVRVIAATHLDLESMVAEKMFRQDLLYRLKVVTINVPPLRDRGEDVRLLTEHYLDHYRKKFGKDVLGFSDEALTMLRNYSYPGNVRELRNIVEYAVSICPSGEIQPEHLPDYLLQYRAEEGIATAQGDAARLDILATRGMIAAPPADPELNWPQMERRLISEALIKSRGNRSKAAQMLGWGRSTLWRKMKLHGLI